MFVSGRVNMYRFTSVRALEMPCAYRGPATETWSRHLFCLVSELQAIVLCGPGSGFWRWSWEREIQKGANKSAQKGIMIKYYISIIMIHDHISPTKKTSSNSVTFLQTPWIPSHAPWPQPTMLKALCQLLWQLPLQKFRVWPAASKVRACKDCLAVTQDGLGIFPCFPGTSLPLNSPLRFENTEFWVWSPGKLVDDIGG